MASTFISNPHQAVGSASAASALPWAWELARNEASTLRAEAFDRWLRVDSGCVWLTRADGTEQASDIWLCAGSSLALPAGTAWVLEAWPQARLSLLVQVRPVRVPALARTSQRGTGGVLAWWSAALRRSRTGVPQPTRMARQCGHELHDAPAGTFA